MIFFYMGFHQKARASCQSLFKKSDTIAVYPYNKIYHEKGVKALLCHNVSRGSILYQESLKTIAQFNDSLLPAWVGCTEPTQKIIGCLWYKAQSPLKKYARVHCLYEQNSVIMKLLAATYQAHSSQGIYIKPYYESKPEIQYSKPLYQSKYAAYCVLSGLLIYYFYCYKKNMLIFYNV